MSSLIDEEEVAALVSFLTEQNLETLFCSLFSYSKYIKDVNLSQLILPTTFESISTNLSRKIQLILGLIEIFECRILPSKSSSNYYYIKNKMKRCIYCIIENENKGNSQRSISVQIDSFDI